MLSQAIILVKGQNRMECPSAIRVESWQATLYKQLAPKHGNHVHKAQLLTLPPYQSDSHMCHRLLLSEFFFAVM